MNDRIVTSKLTSLPVAQVPGSMNSGASHRHLIVNADDFGRSPGVNAGVIQAHQAGVVTSASLMVRWPAAAEAAAYARSTPRFGLGLHFDFGEWVLRDGNWIRAYEVVDLADDAAVAKEVQHQLALFRDLTGGDPTHLDSHQAVHRSGPLASVLVALARTLAVPLRYFCPDIYNEGAYYGQSSQGFSFMENIRADALISIVEQLPPGFTELRCHPGARVDFAATYGDERMEELRVLCDPCVRDAILAQGIELCSFRDVTQARHVGQRVQSSSFLTRGIEAYHRTDYAQAEGWLKKATTVVGAQQHAWLWLARVLLKRQDIQGSLRSVCRALAIQPDWPVAQAHLEVLCGYVDERARYIEDLNRLRTAHAHHLETLRWVNNCLLRLKAYPALMDAADAILRLQPDDEDAWHSKAVAMCSSGSSVQEVRDLVERKLGTESPSAVQVLGNLYLELENPLAAWNLVKCCGAKPVSQALLVRIAQRLWASGQLGAACLAFERAVDREPENTTLRQWWDSARAEARVLSGEWTLASLKAEALAPVAGRVLHVVDRAMPYSQSGYTVRTHGIAQAQRAAGLEPHVVTPLGFPEDSGIAQAPVFTEVDGICYHRLLPVEGIPARLDERLAQNLAQLADVVRRVRPAVLHAASDYRNALLAIELGRAFDIPVVYEVRGFWEETWLSRQPDEARWSERYCWWQARELACMLAADQVVTLAEVMKDYLVERGVPADKIAVMPNAVDSGRFSPASREPMLAEKLKIGPEDVVVGYSSTFWPYEGIQFLIQALHILRKQHPNVCVLLVGDGEERPRLEAQVAALGLADRVIFTGSVPHADIADYYSLIDIFVVPRTADRVSQMVTPLKPVEAMATECAIVVAGVPALEEMVEDGVTGLVFEPENSEHLAAVLESLVANPERRMALGQAARRWVCAQHTWAHRGQRYFDLYQSLMKQPA